MPTIPIKESGDPFGFRDANVPFALENAVYTSGDDTLTITVGAGRARWGDTIFELTAATTDYTVVGPAATTYYVYVDYSAQGVVVNQTAPGPGDAPIATVTFDGSSVTSTSDQRGLTPQQLGVRVQDGTAAAPALGFDSEATGMYLDGGLLSWAVNGARAMYIGTSALVLDGGRDLTVGNTTLSDGQLADSGQLVIKSEAGDLVFQAHGDGTVARYDGSFGGWRFWDDGGEVVRIAGGQLEMENSGNINMTGGSVNNIGVADFNGDIRLAESGGLRGQYDISIDAWRFWNGTNEAMRLDGNNLTIFDGGVRAQHLRELHEGSKANPAIDWQANNDAGFFLDNSLDRLHTTINHSSDSWEASTITTYSDFVPGLDGNGRVGNSTFTWDEIWATDGSINTSDETAKEQIEDSDLGLEFIQTLRPIKFVRKGDDHSRPHYGLGANQVREALDALGVSDMAGYIDPAVVPPDPDQWPEAYNEDGSLNTDRVKKGLRMSEFIGPVIKAVQELADRIEALENA